VSERKDQQRATVLLASYKPNERPKNPEWRNSLKSWNRKEDKMKSSLTNTWFGRERLFHIRLSQHLVAHYACGCGCCPSFTSGALLILFCLTRCLLVAKESCRMWPSKPFLLPSIRKGRKIPISPFTNDRNR